CQQHISYPYSF
nr:immunoglobulin light chain junction region [Macaca mulatta]